MRLYRRRFHPGCRAPQGIHEKSHISHAAGYAGRADAVYVSDARKGVPVPSLRFPVYL